MTQTRELSATARAVIEDIIPICRKLAEGRGRYAISIGGSQGKGTWDSRSDVDFRLFHETDLPWPDKHPELWTDYFAAVESWRQNGVTIDGIWPRRIDAMDAAIDRWIKGEARPDDLVWTIWGYYLLPDIQHQAIIEDPFNVIGGWKDRLRTYPPKLHQVILDRHGGSLRYWRDDYHYRNKVKRGDVVFLAGLSSKLVHDLIQLLFALNETYYVGDGQNLDFAERFTVLPTGFREKVHNILYPSPSSDMLENQRAALVSLIDEVLELADKTER